MGSSNRTPPLTHTPSSTVTAPRPWSPEHSTDLYRMEYWGDGLFNINEQGHLAVHPSGPGGPPIDLYRLTQSLEQRGLTTPLLLRFDDMLHYRLGAIAEAFARSIKEHDYQADYRAVYPIKVNQQRHVVEEMLAAGRPYGFGLEAGSKPELLAVMAMVDDPDTPIICNGFKDASFIEAVVLAAKLGKNIVPVIEKFSELELILEQAKAHNVRPRFGVRVKLASRGTGRWEHSAGHRSKFGLFVSEVLDLAKRLADQDMLDCLTLLHCHVGSQINDIRKLKPAITELARVYAELRRMGVGLDTIDVGGGLGIDYDGTASASDSSMNYGMQEYANDVVFHIQTVCDATNTPHPRIVSESGRAMAAHHSVLVFDVLGWSGFDRFELPDAFGEAELKAMPQPVRTLAECHLALTADNVIEYYHDAQVARDQVLSLFNLGFCSIEHRGLAERLFYSICSRVLKLSRETEQVPEDLAALETLLSDIYFCNCSVFQSLPDHWAIEQSFPVLPIHRLSEEPTCRGILADITCDSDGKIDRFVSTSGDPEPDRVLPLHPYTGEPYYLAVCLVGAYQETLGDLHNLFGDTNAVHVALDADGGVKLNDVVEGDTVREVLGYVQYDPDQLRRQFNRSIEQAVSANRVTLDEARLLRTFYDRGLSESTYLT